MTVVAARALLHLGEDLPEVHRVSAESLIVDELCEIRRLTGETVGKRVRTLRSRHILQTVVVPDRTGVILRESEALIKVHNIRILVDIAQTVIILRVRVHGLHDLRIILRPLIRRDDTVRARCTRSLDLYERRYSRFGGRMVGGRICDSISVHTAYQRKRQSCRPCKAVYKSFICHKTTPSLYTNTFLSVRFIQTLFFLFGFPKAGIRKVCTMASHSPY